MPRSGQISPFRIQILWLNFVTLLICVGCKHQENTSFSNWSRTTDTDSTNAKFIEFINTARQIDLDADMYASNESVKKQKAVESEYRAKAAKLKKPFVASEVPKTVVRSVTRRTTYFASDKKVAMSVIGDRRYSLLNIIKMGTKFHHEPEGLNKDHSYLRGLNIVGNSYIWELEDAIATEKFDNIQEPAYKATLLGCFLLGGSGFDATLGASLIDQTRVRLISVVSKLDQNQLSKLAAKLQSAFKHRPSITLALSHERDDMLQALQETQDLYTSKKYSELRKYLGKGSEDSVNQLISLESKPEKAKDVFDWIGNDINKRSEWRIKRLKNPLEYVEPPILVDRKNWRLLYRYFGTNLDNLAPLLQTCYARSQMFILDCYLRKLVTSGKPLPDTLALFSTDSIRDPFTGKPFYYTKTQTSYLLYSTGEDGVDNLGESLGIQKAPDLTLEKPISR